AAAFLTWLLDTKGGIGGDPIALEGEAKEPRNAREEAIAHCWSRLRLRLDQRADLLARDVLDAHVPPDRQHLFLPHAPLSGPTPLLLGGSLVQLVQRADGVAIRGALVMLFRRGIGAIEDPAALVNRF